jgi:hypothetical protein
LCIVETRNVTNEFDEPVLQHGLPCHRFYRWPIDRCKLTDSLRPQLSFTPNGPRKLLLADFVAKVGCGRRVAAVSLWAPGFDPPALSPSTPSLSFRYTHPAIWMVQPG